MVSILDYANTYHAYVFGTSFWYFLRGIVRVIDPTVVSTWFRPPAFPAEANDLELYTIRTDAFCLLSLAALLLVLADAVPLPRALTGSSLSDSSASSASKKPYAKAVILITILHHIATGIGSYGHWSLPTHRTVAMDIGVFGNIGLTLLGIAALTFGFRENGVPAKKTI